MLAWFAVGCAGASFLKLAFAAFGYHGADAVLDQVLNTCAIVAGPTSATILAKSNKFVK